MEREKERPAGGPEQARPDGQAGAAAPEEGLRALSESMEAAAAPQANLLAQDPELVQDFLVEAREHLARIEACLLEIEQRTHTAETLHAAFRSFHTIKGLAGFLDYQVMQRVAHETETLLDLARNGQLELRPAAVDVILAAGDYLAMWLNAIEAAAAGRPAVEPPPPDELIARVQAAAAGGGLEEAAGEAERMIPLEEPAPAAAARSEPGEAGLRRAGTAAGGDASLIKVDTAKLEYLVDMVGELVIAQTMLRHNPELGQVRSPRLQRDLAHLARVTGEVQKTAMAMRMVPVGQLFRKMTRLVRDLARKSGKQAELELYGEDVELDRTIVEELHDPLVHMLRNSMDHGIEPPAEREAKGKPPAGRIRLKASHQAGMIVIEISDDGRGLDRDRIFRKAVERGLVAADARLSDHEVCNLIFEPGFSTAEQVTDVSGRGVGMDVVRKHINKLRGRIEIVSTSGAGTTFLLKVPLTLAIIDGLVVAVGGERFIVPIFAVREMFRASPEQVFTVEGKGEMVMVRGRLLPLVRLAARLGVEGRSREVSEGLVIVGESGSRVFCLLVDELVGKQEVVIKSLGPAFREARGFAGGAILGDGRVGLILDLAAVAGETGAVVRS
jgi:two-component system chemotaxis sensor kinase CheA